MSWLRFSWYRTQLMLYGKSVSTKFMYAASASKRSHFCLLTSKWKSMLCRKQKGYIDFLHVGNASIAYPGRLSEVSGTAVLITFSSSLTAEKLIKEIGPRGLPRDRGIRSFSHYQSVLGGARSGVSSGRFGLVT